MGRGSIITPRTSSFSQAPSHPTVLLLSSYYPSHHCDHRHWHLHSCLPAHQRSPTVAVASLEVGEAVEDTCCRVHEAQSVIHQAGTSSSPKFPQNVHLMWAWASPRTEEIETALAEPEAQTYRPVPAHGLDDDPSWDAVLENPQRSFSFRYSKVQVPFPSTGR
jgi:hypothetical protein